MNHIVKVTPRLVFDCEGVATGKVEMTAEQWRDFLARIFVALGWSDVAAYSEAEFVLQRAAMKRGLW